MKMPRPRSVFARMLLTALLPIGLLVVLLSTYAVNARLDDLYSAFLERGDATAKQLASLAVVGLFSGDRSMLQATSDHLVQSNDTIARVVIANHDGRIMAEARRYIDTGSVPETSSFSALVVPPVLELSDQQGDGVKPDPLGRVSVEFDMRPTRIAERRVLRNVLIITALAVALTVLLTVVVARQIVRPIDDLRKAVARVQAGDLSTRVDAASRGEVGELQKGFNSMAERIDTSARDLQHQVDAATRDLRKALSDLETRNADLELARQREREANRAKSVFLANMSHEIRTPMNGVLGFAGLLQKTELNETQREFLDTITHSGNNLLAIINDILDFSQMEAGGVQLERVGFRLRDAIEDVTALLTPQAHDKGLDLIPSIARDVPERLIGDVTRLRHILTNLVGNAVKFTDIGEVVLRVVPVQSGDGGTRLEFSVCDTGIGIAEDALPTLFEPFSQGAPSTRRVYGGTGLGLSICRSLCQAMGGTIAVRSTLGEGACFTVSLPFAVDEVPATLTGDTRVSARTVVAVVDLHPLSRAALTQTLAAAGFDSRAYAEPRFAPGDEQPEVWLLRLPANANSDRIAAAIQAIRGQSVSPLCVLLTNADPQLKKFALQQGVGCVQTYPVRSRNLVAAITRCAGGASPTAEAGSEPAHAQDWLSGRSILIVDDNPINLQLLDAMLRAYGARILAADSGRTALQLAQDEDLDLALVDIHMPGMSGIDMARELHRQARHADTRIVALTADAGMRERLDDGDGHFVACLIKPLREDRLREIVSGLLQTGRQRPAVPAKVPPALSQGGGRHPVRDRDAAVRIAGGDEQVADALFAELLARLPGSLAGIQQKYGERDWSALWHSVHKLQGSTAACGVYAMHQALSDLQRAISEESEHDIATGLGYLQREADRLVAEYARPQA